MRRTLLLTTILLLAIPLLFLRPAQTQESERVCETGLPNLADYPSAGPTCKRKLKLQPWLGMPDIPNTNPTLTRCLLKVTVCAGVTKCYQSEGRIAGTGFCDDYSAMHDALLNREICCDPKCEPPRPRTDPWFDNDAQCASRERGTFSYGFNRRNPNEASFSISICGEVIRYVLEPHVFLDRRPVLSSFDVCCDEWRKAVRTKSPCDAWRDLDCDGKPNERDAAPIRASVTREPDDFVSEGGITSIPFWKQIHEAMPPPKECEDCKWELVRLQYSCRNIPRQGRFRREVNDAVYEYEATWNCPNTQSSQVETATATMRGLYCPRPPNRTWP